MNSKSSDDSECDLAIVKCLGGEGEKHTNLFEAFAVKGPGVPALAFSKHYSM